MDHTDCIWVLKNKPWSSRSRHKQWWGRGRKKNTKAAMGPMQTKTQNNTQ